MKRILLFILVNMLAIFNISAVICFLGLWNSLITNQINFIFLMSISISLGIISSLISLLVSKSLAKFIMGGKIVATPQNAQEAWLLNSLQRLAQVKNIKCPELLIFPSLSVNSFATGSCKNNTLLAVSQGLLNIMSQDEIEAVLGHEVSHIVNGDMITLALLQGIINSFIIFLSRTVSVIIDTILFKKSGTKGAYFFTFILLNIIFGLFPSIIVCYFSRTREYKADLGSASLTGKRKMIAALQKLRNINETKNLPNFFTAFGIIPLDGVFLTHPSLEKRIIALQKLK